MDSRTVDKVITEAARVVAGIKPGTTITHLSMGELLGVQRQEQQQRYYNMVRKLKPELQREYGVFLITQHKVGYSIALPGEEISLCQGEFNNGRKKMYRAVARTNLIRVDGITDTEKRAETIAKAQAMANLAGLVRAGTTIGELT